jgi:hypothetical protein
VTTSSHMSTQRSGIVQKAELAHVANGGDDGAADADNFTGKSLGPQ